jgi:hypothetical protein
MRYKNVKHNYKIKYFTIFISHFYVSYSNVNEISYIKAIVNCISKRLLSCDRKIAL